MPLWRVDCFELEAVGKGRIEEGSMPSPFLPERKPYIPCKEMPALYQEERILIAGDGELASR